MADIDATLAAIADGRRQDPLQPVTVVVPSHLSALQLRRRLASMTPFAGVRFETLPRLAELIGAGRLAAQGRAPLARPIGDYLAAQVARDAGHHLAPVRDLPGFARVLRGIFRRLRRGGIRSPESMPVALHDGHLGEVLRLYGMFRRQSASFYDDEDLLEEAAAALRGAQAGDDAGLGAVYVVPPAALSAGADAFLLALRAAAPGFSLIDEPVARAGARFVLAPDPASEAREVVREVIAGLDGGLGLHETAVFHGADAAYPRLLRERLDAARIPAASMPGTPLAETAAGRAALTLAALPDLDFSRSATLDFLANACLRSRLPAGGGPVATRPGAWDRASREAGVTRSLDRWNRGLEALIEDRERALAEDGRDTYPLEALRSRLQQALDLKAVIEELARRLEPLQPAQPAAEFISRFLDLVDAYFDPGAPGLPELRREVEQLGTIAAVGGRFSLSSFAAALRANLEAAHVRDRPFAEGILVADFRLAAGLAFRRVILSGAYEGAFPGAAGADVLVSAASWARLRESFPYVEDAVLRRQRSLEAAGRAAAAATETLVWSAPLNESLSAREFYPSHLMVEAARAIDPAIRSAGELRRAAPRAAFLRRPASPLASALEGAVVDRGERNLREAAVALSQGLADGPGSRLDGRLRLSRARRGRAFSEWDGNLAALAAAGILRPPAAISPTALEAYAACGFRYLCARVLRLEAIDEPEEREVLDPAERGTLVHAALETFFREQKAGGRAAPGEAWTADDVARLVQVADELMDEARRRGRTGLDVYAAHDARTVRADLAAFLDADNDFRRETGAVPAEFEVPLGDITVAGLRLRGIVDRVDRTPDGREAWVIDYKTGSARDFETLASGAEGPLASGTKLQLAAYATAGNAQTVRALYWFISSRAGFRQIGYEPTAQNQALFEAALRAISAGIGAGAFPAVPGEEDEFYGGWTNCRYCDFTRLCSRRREQEHQAKREDAAMRPWLQVGPAARGVADP